MSDSPAPLPLLAYMNDRLAQISWHNERFKLELTQTPLADALEQLADVSEAMVLDGAGVLRNSPDLSPLRNRPEETEFWVDSGVRRGEDIIDLIMADVGSPIIPLRHLSGLEELEEAADFCERLMVALDWAEGWAVNDTWQSLGLGSLAELLEKCQIGEVLIYHHRGELPRAKPAGWEKLKVYIALVGGTKPAWPDWREVRAMAEATGQALP